MTEAMPDASGPVAFVLGGGGRLGAVQVGMLEALVEAGITPDMVVETSIGAINGAVFATSPDATGTTRLREVWTDVGESGLLDDSVVGRLRAVASTRTALHRTAELAAVVDRLVDDTTRVQDLAVDFTCVAEGLSDDGALVIFPEGGDFTRRRRTRAIARLGELGLDRSVHLGEALTTVLPPRPCGILRALDANPEADVVVVAHAGLDGLSSVKDVLTRLPMQHSVRTAWWYVPRKDVPQDKGARTDWLYDWWERIDTWVQDHKEPGLP